MKTQPRGPRRIWGKIVLEKVCRAGLHSMKGKNIKYEGRQRRCRACRTISKRNYYWSSK